MGMIRGLGSAAGAMCLALAGQAMAQSANVPNYGNYEALNGLFRVGIEGGTATAPIRSAYNVATADDTEDFFDPDVLRARFPTYNDLIGVGGVIDIRGVGLIASYAPNSPTLTIRVPAFDERGQAPYLLTFTGATRDQSYGQFSDLYEDYDSPQAQDFIRRLIRALTRYSPVDPVAGNPGSIQGELTRGQMDLGGGNSAVEGKGANTSGDPRLIGVNANHGKVGRFNVDRYDARFQLSLRPFKGSRTTVKLESASSYSRIASADAIQTQAAIAVEVPIKANLWSLEPRIGYGLAASDTLGTFGHLVNAAIASRVAIYGVGRGHFVIGNSVGYSQTLSTKFTGYDLDPGLRNWSFRNGVAYDLPIHLRASGRSLSLRANYAFTKFTGSQLYNDSFHDVSVSIGFRSREDAARRIHETIRLNASGVFARGYRSGAVGVGFRF